MLKFYGYKKCNTCRNAEKLLLAMGKEYEFIDITENPPSEPALTGIIAKSGLEIRRFFNTSGFQYKELKIKDKLPAMAEKQIIQLLASNGRLLKRPLVTDGKSCTAGFDEKRFREVWG